MSLFISLSLYCLVLPFFVVSLSLSTYVLMFLDVSPWSPPATSFRLRHILSISLSLRLSYNLSLSLSRSLTTSFLLQSKSPWYRSEVTQTARRWGGCWSTSTRRPSSSIQSGHHRSRLAWRDDQPGFYHDLNLDPDTDKETNPRQKDTAKTKTKTSKQKQNTKGSSLGLGLGLGLLGLVFVCVFLFSLTFSWSSPLPLLFSRFVIVYTFTRLFSEFISVPPNQSIQSLSLAFSCLRRQRYAAEVHSKISVEVPVAGKSITTALCCVPPRCVVLC